MQKMCFKRLYWSFALITLIVFVTSATTYKSTLITDNDGYVCGYTAGIFKVRCPSGTHELYRDVTRGWHEIRFCCDPRHESYLDAKKVPSRCRLTPCIPSPYTSNLCDALGTRYIDDGETQLEYDEVLHESCSTDSSSNGCRAECCVRDSPQSYLALSMGAEPNEFPHMAKLRFPYGDCGGTVYNSRFVITAAHCIIDKETGKVKNSNGIQVIIGTNMDAISDKEYIYEVKNLIPHPDYFKLKGRTNNFSINDIALIELDREIKFGEKVKALEIPDRDFIPLEYADKAVAVGWGTTTLSSDSSLPLHKSNLLMRSDKSCFGKWYFQDLKGFEDQLMCLGGIFEGKWSRTSGKGDSGGPAICRGPNGTALLCGVSSFGVSVDKCLVNGEQCVPSVFTEVAYFHDWIKENAGEQNSSKMYKPYLYGKEMVPGEFLNQVKVTSFNGKSCGGTLIASNFVVTASHCVQGSGKVLYEGLQVTIIGLTGSDTSYKVVEVAVHDK